jgi:hypothetical protein
LVGVQPTATPPRPGEDDVIADLVLLLAVLVPLIDAFDRLG